MKRVLFCPPDFFDVLEVKNPFMRDAAPVDRARAAQQWQGVCRAFAAAGASPLMLEAAEGLEDMVFTNNQVFVGWEQDTGRGFIVPSRMRFPSRQREVPHFVEWFRERGFRVIELGYSHDDYLEGHGDLLWHLDGERIWAGHGIRSTLGAVEKFARAMAELDFEVIPLALADERFYHLDTCFAPLTPESVLIYPGAFTPEAYQTIHEHCPRVHEVTAEDALAFVCNGVALNSRFLTPQLTPRLERALAAEGLEPVLVPTGEFEKSGGSVCCLKLFVDWPGPKD